MQFITINNAFQKSSKDFNIKTMTVHTPVFGFSANELDHASQGNYLKQKKHKYIFFLKILSIQI